MDVERDYSVSDLARILRRSRSSIVRLIKRGYLKAYDAAPEGKNRQYRVTDEALQEFRKRNVVRPKTRRTRTRKTEDEVIRFF